MVVIGLSMGGTVATHLSARLPVAGTVLINPYMVDVNPMMRHAGKVSKVLPVLKAIGSDIAVPGVSEERILSFRRRQCISCIFGR